MPSIPGAADDSALFARIVPVLPVADLDSEIAFYAALGFEATQTISGFTALRRGDILFGLEVSTAPVPPQGLRWQMWSENLDAVLALALAGNLEVASGFAAHPAGFWTLQLSTPNKYVLTLEGPPPLHPSEPDSSAAEAHGATSGPRA